MASYTNPGPSESSEALQRLLEGESEYSIAIKGRFHRTVLWRLVTGRRSPDLVTAVDIDDLTGGGVPVKGWLRFVRRRRGQGRPAAAGGR